MLILDSHHTYGYFEIVRPYQFFSIYRIRVVIVYLISDSTDWFFLFVAIFIPEYGIFLFSSYLYNLFTGHLNSISSYYRLFIISQANTTTWIEIL